MVIFSRQLGLSENFIPTLFSGQLLLYRITDFNFKRNTVIHNYNTRQRDNLYLPASKTNWGKQKLTYQAANDFNNFSPEILTEKVELFLHFGSIDYS